MPIPDFQTLMPVLLDHLGDLQEHSDNEITRSLAEYFGLSPEERARFQPGADKKVFVERIDWVKAELEMAGLIAVSRPGVMIITEQGLFALEQKPQKMDRGFLKQFPKYREKVEAVEETLEGAGSSRGIEGYPREILERTYLQLRRELAGELLERIREGSSGLFKRLVIDLLVAMGYSETLQDAIRSLGTTGDDGVEGSIRADSLGTERIHVRARRRSEPVRRQEVQSFVRAMDAKRAWRGVFLTTSPFSQEAKTESLGVERDIILVNGDEFAKLMIDYGVGVRTTASYPVKCIDHEAFRED